nr:MAG TPA: IBV 3B protein [Caudoviricetes sp.]
MNIFLKDISSILEMNLRAPFNYCYLDYYEHPATRTHRTSMLPNNNKLWIG